MKKTSLILLIAASLWAGMAFAAGPAKPADAKEGRPVTVGAILTTDGNVDSLMALTDGEEAPVKYVFGEKFDKKSLNGIFSVSRAQLTYVPGDPRALLAIKKEPPQARGVVTGAVVYQENWWVAVKPAKGPADGYHLGNWPPGEMGDKIKGLHKGDTVTIRFHTDVERHRIETLDVVKRSETPDDKDLIIERDVEYGRAGDVVLKLDTYRPKAAHAGVLPAVVRIHGGGWSMGSKGGPEILKLQIKDAVKPGVENLGLTLARHGYFVIDIEYRLVPAARFPAAVEDCKCAVRWVRENAKKYSVDPDRIGAVGGSAGGHLALMLALADGKAGLEGAGGHAGYSSRIQAAVSWYGPTDFTAAGHSDLYRKTVEALMGGPYEQNKERYRQASPIMYVSRNAPPILLVHGEEDPAVAFRDSESMAERLKAAGPT